jgi:hypothetical protein
MLLYGMCVYVCENDGISSFNFVVGNVQSIRYWITNIHINTHCLIACMPIYRFEKCINMWENFHHPKLYSFYQNKYLAI